MVGFPASLGSVFLLAVAIIELDREISQVPGMPSKDLAPGHIRICGSTCCALHRSPSTQPQKEWFLLIL
jgi:hypothetical protein